MHYPHDRDLNYYAQLVSERSVVKTLGAQRFRVWELPSGRANEALDCRVYAYAALCGLQHFGFQLNRRCDEVAAALVETPAEPAPLPETDEPPVHAPVPPPRPVFAPPPGPPKPKTPLWMRLA